MWSAKNKVIDQDRYDLILYHDAGNEVVLPNLPNSVIEFIKKNVGRDKILLTDSHTINLSKFSMAQHTKIKNSPQVRKGNEKVD